MLKKEFIERVMKETNRNSETLGRNIRIVQSYFGLGSQSAPTLDSVAQEFNIRSRQRVKQILSENFLNRLNQEYMTAAAKINSLITGSKVYLIEELKDELCNAGYMDELVSTSGLLNFLRAFEMCDEYDVYNSELNKASKGEIEGNEVCWMMEKKEQQKINKIYKKIRSYPGVNGLCNLAEVFLKKKFNETHYPLMKSLIISSKTSWVYEGKDNELWYLFENRVNVMINTMEKCKNVSKNVRIDILADILHHVITKRSSNFTPPSADLIVQYLRNSKYVIMHDDFAKLEVETTELMDIEREVLNYYSSYNSQGVAYSEISDFLEKLNFSQGYIRKALFHSPFIYVDRNRGRGNFRLLLASQFENKDLPSASAYEDFKQQLKLLKGDTDIAVGAKARKEQVLLRRWLFKNKETETCAICGKLVSVKALVTAHKKKRSLCSEGERTDPHIVMPLCLYGCDYLYEHGFIKVVEGVVVKHHIENLQKSEKDYVELLNGRQLDKRWLEGNPTYFL
ncbi:hypothetical protein [Mesobacillus foraminis]|uniref:hypothetical protein n=1 Tax=Mesobacillus foraminis TaxID=279826 RepID=UPI000EF4422B|nr:hypothetical protein [Mesobacillus foraminis]